MWDPIACAWTSSLEPVRSKNSRGGLSGGGISFLCCVVSQPRSHSSPQQTDNMEHGRWGRGRRKPVVGREVGQAPGRQRRLRHKTWKLAATRDKRTGGGQPPNTAGGNTTRGETDHRETPSANRRHQHTRVHAHIVGVCSMYAVGACCGSPSTGPTLLFSAAAGVVSLGVGVWAAAGRLLWWGLS